MTSEMDTGNTDGLISVGSRAGGTTTNNTDWVFISRLSRQPTRGMASGRWVKDFAT